jgi:hypothetical protein
MDTDMQRLTRRLNELETEQRRLARRLRLWQSLAGCLVLLAVLVIPLRLDAAPPPGKGSPLQQIAELQLAVDALTELLLAPNPVNGEPFLQRVGDHFILTGANLCIVNGLGDTETTNSVGNLIMGYNETQPEPWERTGSHNIIVGPHHGWESFGGIAVGWRHRISGKYASVSGGELNVASGDFASISGGFGSTASGRATSINGGVGNLAETLWASIGGGQNNIADGVASSVTGGFRNRASNHFASVSGGAANTASGRSAAVSGGFDNVATAEASAVNGGFNGGATGEASSVCGGRSVVQDTAAGWAAGSLGPVNLSANYRSP